MLHPALDVIRCACCSDCMSQSLLLNDRHVAGLVVLGCKTLMAVTKTGMTGGCDGSAYDEPLSHALPSSDAADCKLH